MTHCNRLPKEVVDAPSLEAFKAKAGCGSGQPGLVVGDPAYSGGGGWNSMIIVVLFNPGHSMILWNGRLHLIGYQKGWGQTRESFIPSDTLMNHMLLGSSHNQTNCWSDVRNSVKYCCLENCHFSTKHFLVSAKGTYITRMSVSGIAKTIQAEKLRLFSFFSLTKNTPEYGKTKLDIVFMWMHQFSLHFHAFTLV